MQFITCPLRNLGLLVPHGTFFFISSRIPQGFTCAALPNTLPGWGKQLELARMSNYSWVNGKQCQWTWCLREATLLVLIWSNVTTAIRQWTQHLCAQDIMGTIERNPRGPCKEVGILSFPSYKWGHGTHPKSHWVWSPCFTCLDHCSHHCCLLQTVHVRHGFLTWEQTLAICLNSLLSLMRKIGPKNLRFRVWIHSSPHYIFYDPNVRTSRFWDMLCKGLFSTTLRNAVILISDGSRMTIQLNRPGLEHKW